MKRLTFLLLLSLLLVSCGTRSGHFKVEGRFMHLNQGELYVYSPDGIIQGFDTIKVEAGRFAYEIPCTRSGELLLVFPNFSEHPIFAESGGTVEVKADASHLKEMEVTGTEENKLMTRFRKMIAQASPPEEKKYAAQFIEDHPESRTALFLLRKYYLRTPSADFAEGTKLADIMLQKQPDNGQLRQLKQLLQQRNISRVGQSVPAFTVKDVNGQPVTEQLLRSADMAVVLVWSSWSFQSLDMLRTIHIAMEKKSDLKMLGISVDARPIDCQRQMEINNITSPVICDGQMMESAMLKKLGLFTVPAVLIVRKGKITERNIDSSRLRSILDDYVK